MKFRGKDKSIIDTLFLLALFGVFLISALFIVLFGAKIYKNVVKSSDESFYARTSLSYITEKLRQNDNSKGIEIIEENNETVIKLYQEIDNFNVCTYIYTLDGSLMEFTTTEGNEFYKDYGTRIMDISDFKVEKRSDSLYHFIITDIYGNNSDFFISIYSDKEDK